MAIKIRIELIWILAILYFVISIIIEIKIKALLTELLVFQIISIIKILELLIIIENFIINTVIKIKIKMYLTNLF